MSMTVGSDSKRVGRRVSIGFASTGRTHQSFKAQCDINTIVAKSRAIGALPPPTRVAMFGDFSSVPDYASALAVVNNAQAMFDSLPSKTRERFFNDPERMVSFLADKDNLEESYKLGLRVKPVVKPEPEPLKVRVVPDSPPVK